MPAEDWMRLLIYNASANLKLGQLGSQEQARCNDKSANSIVRMPSFRKNNSTTHLAQLQ